MHIANYGKMLKHCLNKNKLGQLKIQQMAVMLIAVTLFFVLVGLFVLTIKVSDIRERANLLEEENAVLLASKIANSPEFSCGGSYGTGKSSCVDFDKIMALSQNIEKYEDFWGVSEIEIRKIYPSDENDCTMQNYPNCGVLRVFSDDDSSAEVGVSNFVSLCKKEASQGRVYDKCDIAKIIISYEEND